MPDHRPGENDHQLMVAETCMVSTKVRLVMAGNIWLRTKTPPKPVRAHGHVTYRPQHVFPTRR